MRFDCAPKKIVGTNGNGKLGKHSNHRSSSTLMALHPKSESSRLRFKSRRIEVIFGLDRYAVLVEVGSYEVG